mmetsp:Transcript_30722/g.51963  ORF Transcript_30722/g.51963 Transcript_30722/m.51963 type:complete len:558 (+) Transcript_30722:77-1750(+)
MKCVRFLSPMKWARWVALFFACILYKSSCALHPIQCRDPDVGGTAQNKDRKFLVLGSDGAGGAGLGNILIFFPAAFYFAAVTGRDIIITDHSIIGEMCQIVHCGFPFVSQVALAFPDILTPEALGNPEDIKSLDFQRYMEGSKPIDAKVVRAAGYQSKSDWWVWYNTTVHCVQRITGCDKGDVMCTERHAYQRLIRGPFISSLSEAEERRIHGVPDNLKHAILTLPHAFSPRLDAAVHLRAQFDHFEHQSDVNDPEYLKEVAEFLASPDCKNMFAMLLDSLVTLVEQQRPSPAAITANTTTATGAEGTMVTSGAGANAKPLPPLLFYIAADNQQVKEAFNAELAKHPTVQGKINIMHVESKGVFHAKNIKRLKDATSNEGLLDLVFDWYALSLANNIYAWRKGGTSNLSTFVHSAQKVSGTTDRTNVDKGRGIGTNGYALIKTRSGGMRYDRFWIYTFMDDFRQPGDRRRYRYRRRLSRHRLLSSGEIGAADNRSSNRTRNYRVSNRKISSSSSSSRNLDSNINMARVVSINSANGNTSDSETRNKEFSRTRKISTM